MKKRVFALLFVSLLTLSLCACGGEDEGTEQPQQDTESTAKAIEAADKPTAEGLRQVLSSAKFQEESLSPFTIMDTEQGERYVATIYNGEEQAGIVLVAEDGLFMFEANLMPVYVQSYAQTAIQYLSPENANEVGSFLLVVPDFGTYLSCDAGGYRFISYYKIDGLNSKYYLQALDGSSLSNYQEGRKDVIQLNT